jgi:hypothetical protein
LRTNKQIAAEFDRNLSRFYETSNAQRDEIFISYQYRDCNQASGQSINRPEGYARPFTVVNTAAPIVRAVAGSEVMSASTLDYISTDPQFDSDADCISDAVEWCQYASDFYAQRSIAAEDAATCGIGAYVTYLDMTQKDFIAGVPMCERVTPAFLFYDRSARGSMLNRRGAWCGYADPIDSIAMDDYIENNKEVRGDVTVGDYRDYILSYSYIENQQDIEFIYHYFWREWTKIYDVANPFVIEGAALAQAALNDNTVANLIGEFAKNNGLNWKAQYWTLDKDAFKELTELVETIQLLLPQMQIDDLEYSKRNGIAYYRAQFARGIMLKKSLSYTQHCHALNFITGYYDESTGNYYGMMRPLSFIQDYLNIAMADLLDFTQGMITGGDSYISTPAGKEDAIARIAKAKKTTGRDIPVPEGAIVTPKGLPSSPEVLISMVNMLMEIMPRVLGLGQEFFGVITSGDMTDSLFGRVMKQSFAVLENWKNSSANSDLNQGYIFMDLVRVVAEANDGMVIPVLSPDNNEQTWFNLSLQNLARNYAIRIVERKMTKDERQETFNKLSQLAPQAMQAGVNIFPMLARYAALDKSDRDEMVQLATPKPPQPDPINQATLQANINYTNASAEKAMADAEKTRAEVLLMQQRNQLDDIEQSADIEEKQAGAELSKARAIESLSKAKSAEFEQSLAFMQRMDSRIGEMLNNY